MSLLVIGTVAYDSIETPYESRDEILGGSATYFAVASHGCGVTCRPIAPPSRVTATTGRAT